MKKTIKLILIGSMLFLIQQVYGADLFRQDGVVERSFEVAAGGSLLLDSQRGTVIIKTHSANRIDVKIERNVRSRSQTEAEAILEDFEISFDHRENDLLIEASSKSNWRYDRRGRYFNVIYTFVIPEVYNVDIQTRGGNIQLADLTGGVEVKTSGGNLVLENINGPVSGATSGGNISLSSADGGADLKTSGGSITIGEVNGNVDARTSGGSIAIERARGTVEARTSGGSIRVNEVMGQINARTSGGSIRAYISQQPQGECRLQTSGGSVTINLSEDIAVNLDARSSGGSVHTDLPVTVRGSIRRTSLQGTINGGGPLLYLRGSGGSIQIRKH